MFKEYPYINLTDLKLDWLMKLVKEVNEKLSEYLENSVITFADPITWDITSQYTALTCVVASDGTAYLSKQPVPAGVNISNTNYWLPIFNYDDNINTLRSQIAYNAGNAATISQDLHEGDLVFWHGLIYQATIDMSSGSALIEGSNIRKYTVDEKINDVSGSVSQVSTDLANEIIDRQNADLTLQGNIDAEVLNRQNADITLQNNIDAEVLNRQNADDDIMDIINTIESGIFVKPESKGAAGDGVTDDTGAVQAAINDVIDKKADAVLLENTYLVTSTLSVPGDCIILGPGTLTYNTPFDVIYASDSKVIMKGIKFSGPAPQDANNGKHIVTLIDTHDSVIERCNFNNVNGESAIYVDSCTNTVVRDNFILNFSFIGILIYRDCTNTLVQGNVIVNCVNTSSGYGIQNNVPGAGGAYATDLILDGNIIKHVPCWDGIMSHGGTNVIITNNICDDCRTGIDCSAKYTDAFSIQKNYVISDNVLISSTDTSIPGSNINAGIIFGYDNSSMSYCATIANNEIRNFSIGTGGNTGGIRLSNCAAVKVIGNNILNCTRAMIWASNYRPDSDWTISGNMFECTSQGFNIGAGVYKNIAVVGNNFKSLGTGSWAFGVGSGARLIRCFERANTFENIYQAPPSSGARQTFYTEKDANVNANQQNSVYEKGDKVYCNTPSSNIGWVAMNTGVNAPTAWAASTDLTLGAAVSTSGRAYVCTIAGTTGGSAPTHTDGEAANGSATLLYVGDSSVTWRAFGALI